MNKKLGLSVLSAIAFVATVAPRISWFGFYQPKAPECLK